MQQGQAVWKPEKNKPELAGEILLATNRSGNVFIQFSKTPFTLVTAQIVEDRWQIEFGSGVYRRAGHGQPPKRFVWFQLPRGLAGGQNNREWQFNRLATNSWRVINPQTGELLEASFFP